MFGLSSARHQRWLYGYLFIAPALWPLIVARQPPRYTAQIALHSFVLTYTVEWQKFMAAGVMIALPVLLLYLILQPYFEQSLGALGRGVKG